MIIISNYYDYFLDDYHIYIYIIYILYIYTIYMYIYMYIWKGPYGLVDKTYLSWVRAGFNTRVQHYADRPATTPPLQLSGWARVWSVKTLCIYMGVSINGGIPKSSNLIRNFGVSPFMEAPVYCLVVYYYVVIIYLNL